MDSFCMKIYILIGIFTISQIHSCHGEKRMMDYPASWQPVAYPPGAQNLISIANFDVTNKAQLSQIAHHNAQILRQIKGLHPPVTQYHNPFPMFPSGNNAPKHLMVQTNNVHQHARYQPRPSEKFPTTQNLLGSSSNVAQTVLPHIPMKPHGFLSAKPSFLGTKPDFNNYKYFNNLPLTSKVPPNHLANAASAQNYQIFSTTSRIPLLRDVTLSAPSSVYKSTQLPAPLINKINSQIGLSSRPSAQGLIASNQIPGHVISSFSHFGPASQVITNSKPRIRANFVASPFDPHHFSNPYAGHLIPSGQFVGKNNFVNSLHFPNSAGGAYHLTNTFLSSPVKPNSEALLLHQQKSNLPSLPTVPPSVLSPFFQQVQQQQQESVATAVPNDQRRPEPNKPQYSDPFKVLNDEYSVHLVPPPVRQSNPNYVRNLPTAQPTATPTEPPPPPPTHDYYDEEHKKAMDILNKYNIPAISPLQDINRFMYNAGPFKALPTATMYPTASSVASFTTQHPNTFKNNVRRPENEYQQHKPQHPSFTGPKYSNDPKLRATNKPFLPTPDTSPDLAITHSFFTIEDAITLSPHLHYRRPIVSPTNTNQIEEIIRKPQEEQITEVATVGDNSEADTTLQPPPSSSVQQNRQRNRNKVRRKRPRPSTESVIEAEEPQHRNPMQNHRNKLQDERDEVAQTNIPKNHKAFVPTTRDRETLLQRPKDTTVDNNHAEVTTTTVHRTTNRGRIPSVAVETFSDQPQKTKDQRRPNNRFEDNKIPRYRPQTTTKSVFSSQPEESESTTVNFRDNAHTPKYPKASRRPVTTHQSIVTTTSDEDLVTDMKVMTSPIETYPQTRLPPKTRHHTSQPTTPISPTTPNIIIGTAQAHPEENSVVISTKIGVTSGNDGKYTTEREFISYEEEISNESKTSHPGEISTQTTQSTSTTTSSESPELVDISKESMVTSDGPVYKPLDHLKQRPRLRQKDKLLEAAEKAIAGSRHKEKQHDNEEKGSGHSTTGATRPASPTRTSTPKDRGSIKNNDVTDTDGERGNLRLPLHKGTVKIIEDTTEAVNVTKSNRLNTSASNKYDAKHRPRFSVKEYRQRLSSTTTSDPSQSGERESTTSSYTRLRFPTRNRFVPQDIKNKTQEVTKPVIDEKLNLVVETQERPEVEESSSSEQTEVTRKRFSPKDRYSSKVKSTTDSSSTGATSEAGTVKPSTRRGSTRRDFVNNRVRFSTTTIHPPVDASNSRLPIIRNASAPLRRPQTNISLRQRIQNSKRPDSVSSDSISDESVNDLAVESSSDEHVSSTEEYKHETAIMKIAKDDHSYRPYMHRDRSSTTSTSSTESSVMTDSDNDLNESPSHQSERVAELTIFGSNQFSTVKKGTSSRRIPNYFTIATEDPILPIEAFFPQVKRH